ncbi:hypothetical protein BH23CHL1_BH23CHL1_08030 [soil metagenome]
MAASNVEAMSRQIEQAREKLLDLGLRNSLINHRPLRARGVEVVDELPAEIFQMLVPQSRRMSFDPAPDAESQSALALTQPEEDPLDGRAARHTDQRLQTSVPSAQLQSRLLATYYAARTSIEEQGVNVLFIALGMLEWYESASSQEPRKAPLVLIPVELTRSNALDRFHLSYTGEEIGANLSIEAKLKTEFNVQLPAMAAAEDLDIDAYFAEVETTISYQARWRVDRGAVALGFFSFGKFLMYRDLDLTTWPDELQPTNHPILRSLLGGGFNEPASAIGEDAFLDPLMKDADIHQVVDADSSQTVTILDAIHGRNLVVQGPPGTGKSQTITNIIAEAIGAGKSVLFVAEKMAALEVVKRRLDSVGLGDACLELHSNKMNKRSVIQELQRTLELGRPRVDTLETELTTLDSHRGRLNDYCDAINTPIAGSGVTPYEAYGQLAQAHRAAAEAEWPRPQLPGIETWPADDFTRRQSIVQELQARIAGTGIPSEHPFWGVRKSILLPSDEPRLRVLLTGARNTLDALGRMAAGVAAAFQLQTPASLQEAETLVAALQRASAAPEAPGLAFVDDAWRYERDRLTTLLDAGEQWMEIRNLQATTLKPDVWERDVNGLRDTLAEYRSTWWRILSGSYRSARSELAGLCQDNAPNSMDEQLQLVDDIIESQRLAEVIHDHRTLGLRLYGDHYKGTDSNWAELQSWADWVQALHDDVEADLQPAGVLTYLENARDRVEAASQRDALTSAMTAYTRSLDDLQALTEFDAERRFGAGSTLVMQPFVTQYQLLQSWTEHIVAISQMTAINISGDICSKEELGPVFELSQHWPGAATQIERVLLRARYEALLEKALLERPALAQFDGDGHGHVVSRFRELDLLTFEHNRSRLAHAHWSRVPRGEGGGQLAVLRREFEKKSRHLPVRQLVERAGNAIQAIKPVFMMSPLSIATYIPPGTLTFDLVIFDEASQVKPVDAFGALLRGDQAVVVGDSKQLPPTSFFDSLIHTDEDEEENATSDIESILGLFAASNAPQRMLRWHYRSRHESLITVSNHEFYENRLVLFPSPDASRAESGLHYHHLQDTSYDRGKTRTNPGEAAAVAAAVMAHARQSPELTLGVAAFSVAQTQAVIDQVELLRRQDPSCETFFAAHPNEPFFVKNLENVQGDERDVIFISVGYGRTAEGYLAMSFGPLNNDGGERRLNVLITRARRRCEVFTNLTSDDIDLNRTQARSGIVQTLPEICPDWNSRCPARNGTRFWLAV